MTSAERIRSINRCLAASVIAKGNWTQPEAANIVANAGGSLREEIHALSLRSASTAAFVPPPVGGNQPADVPGTAMYSMTIWPGQIVVIPGQPTACTSTAADMLDINHPAFIAKKIPQPIGYPVHHVGQPEETVYFSIIAFSGSPAAQATIKQFVDVGSIFSIPGNVGVLVLHADEGIIINQLAEIEKGKAAAALLAEPLRAVHELSQITPAKTLLYKTYNKLYYIYGQIKFNAIFTKPGAVLEDDIERVPINNFSEVNLIDMINNLLRTTIDSSLLNEGLQLTNVEAQALAQLAIGNGVKHLSSGHFVTILNQKFGKPPAAVAQSVQNLDCFFQVISLMFDKWFVDRLKALADSIVKELKPTSGAEFSNLFDRFVGSIGHIPETNAVSMASVVAFVEQSFDLSEANALIREWRRSKLAEAEKVRDVQLASLQAQVDGFQAKNQTSTSHTPSSTRTFASKRGRFDGAMSSNGGENGEQTRLFRVELNKYLLTRPIALPSVGTPDLCPRTAQGTECHKHGRGTCTHLHAKNTKWMVPKYIKWCANIPSFQQWRNAKKSKVENN